MTTSQAEAACREYRLSPQMVAKMIEALTLNGAPLDGDRRTERALIVRGLAEAVRGTAERNYHGHTHPMTVYDAYSGARLNEAGVRVAELLRESV